MIRMMDEIPSEEEEARWESEYHRHVFKWAVSRVKPQVNDKTWQAFWRTAIDDEDANAVAEALGMDRGAVYVAKSRVIARMKQAVESAAGELGEGW